MAAELMNVRECKILDFIKGHFSWSLSFLYYSFLPLSPLSSKNHMFPWGRALHCSHAHLSNTPAAASSVGWAPDGSRNLPSSGPFSEVAFTGPGFPQGGPDHQICLFAELSWDRN